MSDGIVLLSCCVSAGNVMLVFVIFTNLAEGDLVLGCHILVTLVIDVSAAAINWILVPFGARNFLHTPELLLFKPECEILRFEAISNFKFCFNAIAFEIQLAFEWVLG